MEPPRLIGNTGESGVFVLLNVPGPPGEKSQRTDDFIFTAASWTLTSHEAGAGDFRLQQHERGRMGPLLGIHHEAFMPLDGQLISSQTVSSRLPASPILDVPARKTSDPVTAASPWGNT
jgi:hypothetical protein